MGIRRGWRWGVVVSESRLWHVSIHVSMNRATEAPETCHKLRNEWYKWHEVSCSTCITCQVNCCHLHGYNHWRVVHCCSIIQQHDVLLNNVPLFLWECSTPFKCPFIWRDTRTNETVLFCATFHDMVIQDSVGDPTVCVDVSARAWVTRYHP